MIPTKRLSLLAHPSKMMGQVSCPSLFVPWFYNNHQRQGGREGERREREGRGGEEHTSANVLRSSRQEGRGETLMETDTLFDLSLCSSRPTHIAC